MVARKKFFLHVINCEVFRVGPKIKRFRNDSRQVAGWKVLCYNFGMRQQIHRVSNAQKPQTLRHMIRL